MDNPRDITIRDAYTVSSSRLGQQVYCVDENNDLYKANSSSKSKLFVDGDVLGSDVDFVYSDD